jgi:hypothetical protein
VQGERELLHEAALERDVEQGVHLAGEALDVVQLDLGVRGNVREVRAGGGEALEQAAHLQDERLLVTLRHELVLPLAHLTHARVGALHQLGGIAAGEC